MGRREGTVVETARVGRDGPRRVLLDEGARVDGDGSGSPSLTSSTGSRGPGTRARRAPLPLRVARGGDRRVNGGSARNTRDGTGLVRARRFFRSSLTVVLGAGARGALGRYPSRAQQRVLVAGRRAARRRGLGLGPDAIVLARAEVDAPDGARRRARAGRSTKPVGRRARPHPVASALPVVDSDEISDLAIGRRRVRVSRRQLRARRGVDGDSRGHDARRCRPASRACGI